MQMLINSEFQQHHAMNVKRELIDQGYNNSNIAPPHNQQTPQQPVTDIIAEAMRAANITATDAFF